MLTTFETVAKREQDKKHEAAVPFVLRLKRLRATVGLYYSVLQSKIGMTRTITSFRDIK